MKESFPAFSALTWLTIFGSVAAAQESGELAYRVAGTMVTGDTPATAIIESSAGTQQSYRLGDHIDDWEISAIDSREVTLSRAGESVRLPLQGELSVLAGQVQDAPEPYEIRTTSGQIDFDQAFDRMKALESRQDSENSRLDYAEVNEVLGLPAATRIREIDGEAVASPMAIVQSAMVALAAENPFRLTLGENDEMYLLPSE